MRAPMSHGIFTAASIALSKFTEYKGNEIDQWRLTRSKTWRILFEIDIRRIGRMQNAEILNTNRKARMQEMKKAAVLVCTLFLVGSFSACSSDNKLYHDKPLPDPRSFNAHFPDLDEDENELVGWNEFQNHFPNFQKDVFDAVDLNRDGFLDHDEWHAFKMAHGLKHTGGEGYHKKHDQYSPTLDALAPRSAQRFFEANLFVAGPRRGRSLVDPAGSLSPPPRG